MMFDFNVFGLRGDTVFILCANNDEAKAWLDENVQDDAQYFGRGIVVEHRYLDDLLEGIRGEGFTVETEF